MGVQHGRDSKAERSTSPAEFSPQSRAKRTADRFREQVMSLAGGSISEFNELMASDVSTYLLKFEAAIKAQNGNKG
jgi:hypothetical protein